MLSDIGIPGLILILVVALIVFGPNKLPEIGRAFGNSIREFKDSIRGIADEDSSSKKKENESSR